MVLVNESNNESTILRFGDNYHIENSNTQDSFGNENRTLWSLEGKTILQHKRNMGETVTISEIEKEFPCLESYHLKEILGKEVDNETSKLLYIIFEYSIYSFKGTAGPKSCTPEELRQYLDQTIPLDRETKLECLHKVSSIERPDFFLDFKVIEGLRLKFKNLSSGLFCKLWMKSDEKDVKFTKVVNGGSNPRWNVNDSFHFESLDGNILHIEVHRKETKKEENSSNNSKTESNRGSHENVSGNVEEFNGKLKGRSELKTADIYCEGTDKWVPIRSPNNRNLKGRLRIAAKLRRSEDFGGLQALKRHLLMIKLCSLEHLKRESFEGIITGWEKISSSLMSTLLFLHSVIESIPMCEDAICWFSVVNHLASRDKIVSFQFRYTLLYNCVKSIRKLSKQDYTIEISLKDMLEKQFTSLKKESLTFIENLHSHDLGGSKDSRQDFEHVLRIILLSKGVSGISCEPIAHLKTEAQNWFEKTDKEIASVSQDKAKYIIWILEYHKEFQVAADKVIGKVFPEMTYTGIIYDYLDKFANETLKTSIQSLELTSDDSEEDAEGKISMGLKLFEESKRFILYAYKTINSPESKFLDFCDWFGNEVMQNWFEWKKRLAIRQIKMTLCFDDAMHMHSMSLVSGRSKVSSSFIVVPHIIQKCISHLWELVSISGSSRCDALFLNCLHECCTMYASELAERSSPKNSFGDSVKIGKKRTCILANNMFSMASFVEETVFGSVGPLFDNLPNTSGYLMELCETLSNRLIEMHDPVLDKRIKKVSESRNRLKQRLEVKKYADFVEKVVWKEARKYMIPGVFKKFLKNFWAHVLVTVEKVAFNYGFESDTSLKGSGKPKCNFDGLLQILRETEKLCTVGDRVQFTKCLSDDEFKSVQKKLIAASGEV